MADISVAAEAVSKKFSRSLKHSFVYGAADLAFAFVGRGPEPRLRPTEFWALSKVSFVLERGASLGIVGLNGSGKTTLLRTICGILKPTAGRITVNGKIAPLLALGAGFKPVLSGRDNVYLNLSLLGLSEAEITRRFDDVVDFAELREAIDAPVGTYSSGMIARLGFACAVHTDPGILVVDEVLSVGDSRFRAKCRNKINELRRRGTSMLLVSHSAISVETLCDQCLYLAAGKSVLLGEPLAVLKRYEEDSIEIARAQNARKLQVSATDSVRRPSQGAFAIGEVHIEQQSGDGLGYWSTGQQGIFKIKLSAQRIEHRSLSLNVLISGTDTDAGVNQQLAMSCRDSGWLTMDELESLVCLIFDPVVLRPSVYRVKISLTHGAMHDILDVVDNIKLVVSDSGKIGQNPYYQPRRWMFEGLSSLGEPNNWSDEDPEVAESY